jgi:alpha-tubulin suppressor-like RCC1 family protein
VAGSSGFSPHSFALFDNGQVWGWGRHSVALGTDREGMVPQRLIDLAGIVPMAMASGSAHTLVLAEDGTVWAWGGNGNGQLGDGNAPQDSETPVQVDFSALPEGVRIVALEAHPGSSYALADDGTVWAWGFNDTGQLGNGTSAAANVGSAAPVPVVGSDGTGVLTGIVQISASRDAAGLGSFVLALDEAGHVWTWGDCTLHTGNVCKDTCGPTSNPCNTKPQFVCAPGQMLDECVMDEVPLTGVAAVSAGHRVSVALMQDGTVRTWGDYNKGQLGTGVCASSGGSTIPVQVFGPLGQGALDEVVAIDAGRDHVLALLQDGSVWGWGDNDRGQLGNAPRATSCGTSEAVPIRVSGLDAVTVLAIASGAHYGLALDALGRVWSWGSNANGELGTQARTNCAAGACSYTALQLGLLPR